VEIWLEKCNDSERESLKKDFCNILGKEIQQFDESLVKWESHKQKDKNFAYRIFEIKIYFLKHKKFNLL